MYKYNNASFSISNIYQHLVEQSKIERVDLRTDRNSPSALTTWSRVPTQSQEWRSCGRSRSKVGIMLPALKEYSKPCLSRRDIREKFVDTMKNVIKGNFFRIGFEFIQIKRIYKFYRDVNCVQEDGIDGNRNRGRGVKGSETNLEENWKVEGFYWIKKTRRD